MGILFILDGHTGPEPINTFLTLCATKEAESKGSEDDGPAGVFRIITSQDRNTKLWVGMIDEADKTKPPINDELLANNEFAGMSMDDIEEWMLFRAKIAMEDWDDDGRQVEFGEVQKYFWAMDAKDVENQTCTVMQMKQKSEGGTATDYERPVIKVRVPWESVHMVELSLRMMKMMLEEFTEEDTEIAQKMDRKKVLRHASVDKDQQLPKHGWCTFAW